MGEALCRRFPELLRGQLTGDEAVATARHVEGCETCQALARAYELVGAALDEEVRSRTEGHPSSEQLVTYALRLAALAPDERESLAAHLVVCSECTRQAETVRHAEAATGAPPVSMRQAPRRGAALGPNLRAALAAGVVFAVLGYPAYVGLTHRASDGAPAPSGSEETAETTVGGERTPARRLAPAGLHPVLGPAVWRLLEPPTRGQDLERVTIPVAAEHRVVGLLVRPPDPPPDAPASTTVRIEILRADAGLVRSWERPLSRIRLDMSRDHVVLLLPAEELPAGRYRLLMILTVSDSVLKSEEILFRVEPAEG
jgi:hypothetical protein